MKKCLVGNVVRINSHQVTICGYDYDSDEDQEDRYVIGMHTRFENIHSLEDISRDDQVQIVYEQNEGKNIILHLVWQGRGGFRDAHLFRKRNIFTLTRREA